MARAAREALVEAQKRKAHNVGRREAEMLSKQEYTAMPAERLKDICRAWGLQTGTKKEMVPRLFLAWSTDPAPAAEGSGARIARAEAGGVARADAGAIDAGAFEAGSGAVRAEAGDDEAVPGMNEGEGKVSEDENELMVESLTGLALNENESVRQRIATMRGWLQVRDRVPDGEYEIRAEAATLAEVLKTLKKEKVNAGARLKVIGKMLTPASVKGKDNAADKSNKRGREESDKDETEERRKKNKGEEHATEKHKMEKAFTERDEVKSMMIRDKKCAEIGLWRREKKGERAYAITEAKNGAGETAVTVKDGALSVTSSKAIKGIWSVGPEYAAESKTTFNECFLEYAVAYDAVHKTESGRWTTYLAFIMAQEEEWRHVKALDYMIRKMLEERNPHKPFEAEDEDVVEITKRWKRDAENENRRREKDEEGKKRSGGGGSEKRNEGAGLVTGKQGREVVRGKHPCVFFNGIRGCRKGDGCDHEHVCSACNGKGHGAANCRNARRQ